MRIGIGSVVEHPARSVPHVQLTVRLGAVRAVPFAFVGGNGAVDIWEVKVPEKAKVVKDPFAEKDGHHTSWMVGRKIPPSDLKRIKTQWHPIEYEGDLNDPLPEEYL